MATSFNTPGAYVEDVTSLPASVVAVATAIPAFIGLTEKAEKDALTLINIPTSISSMIEFEMFFGAEKTLEGSDLSVTLDEANNYAVNSISIKHTAQSFLYNSVQLFFDNGGSQCYIISTGLFKNINGQVEIPSLDSLSNSLQAASLVDEITLLVIPDAVLLAENDFYQLQQTALQQAAKLQDRFAILDLYEKENGLTNAVGNFRQQIGTNNLQYGAAYTPWLFHNYPTHVPFEVLKNNCFNKDGSVVDCSLIINNYERIVKTLAKATEDSKLIARLLEAACDATSTGTLPSKSIFPLKAVSATERFNQFSCSLAKANKLNAKSRLNYLISFVRNLALRFTQIKFSNAVLTDQLINEAAFEWRNAVVSLIGLEKNKTVQQITGLTDEQVNVLYHKKNIAVKWLNTAIENIAADANNYSINANGDSLDLSTILSNIEKSSRSIFQTLLSFAETINSTAIRNLYELENNLYQNYPVLNNIVTSIEKELSKIPPSGAVAGVYASIDNNRGVWKAPANISINAINSPVSQINDATQEDLNVDVNEGKSINAIRTFTGKGTLVWGARTLAGNDNEWRYISVRRFCNMVEESCKKSTAFIVFEPNDVNTWVRLQAMIENFLTVQWSNGALQGTKPEHAFYVAVGLNKTMTDQDIADEKMIVEIGMAVVRPAEFVILRFTHAMQTS